MKVRVPTILTTPKIGGVLHHALEQRIPGILLTHMEGSLPPRTLLGVRRHQFDHHLHILRMELDQKSSNPWIYLGQLKDAVPENQGVLLFNHEEGTMDDEPKVHTLVKVTRHRAPHLGVTHSKPLGAPRR